MLIEYIEKNTVIVVISNKVYSFILIYFYPKNFVTVFYIKQNE